MRRGGGCASRGAGATTTRRALVLLGLGGLVSILSSCSSTRPFGRVVMGTRRGEEDRVDEIGEVDAGSRKHLAAQVEVKGSLGWVVATWTIWAKGTLPKVVQTKMFNTAGPTTLFTHLDPSTVSGGWPEGSITCEVRASGGEIAAGRLRVVAR